MKHYMFTLFFCIILTVKCNNIIDVDDILSESFMPGNLLMLENSMEGMLSNVTANLKRNNSSGNINDAISTMGFHRSKINEYLCRNFLAEQIVAEMSMPKIRRRLGIAEDSSGTTIKEDMINDEGSKNYKNWLSKSTMLEDIYRHYEADVSKRTDEQSEDKEDDEEYDSRVTGYAYQPSPKQYNAVNNNHNPGYTYITPGIAYNGYNGQIGLNLGQPGYAGIYDNVNTNYGAGYGGIHNVAGYNNMHEGHSAKYHNSGSKDKDLTELFEIASTALAYLSFGIFIIHVIMCVSSVSSNSTTVVTMMPMSMNPSGPEPTGGGMTSDGMMGNGQMTMTGTGGASMTMTGTGGGTMTMTGTGGESMTMPATGGGSMTMTGAEGGSMTMPDTGGGSMTMTGTGGASMTMTGNGGESMTMTDTGNGDMTMTSTGGGSMTMMGMNGDSMTGTGEGTMPGTNGGDGMTGNGDMPNTGDDGGSDGNGGAMTSTGGGSTMPGTSDGSDMNTGGDTTMPGTSDGSDNTGDATMPGTSNGDSMTGNGADNAMPGTGAGTSDGGDTTGTMPGTGDGTDTGGDTTGTMPGTAGGTSDGTDTTGSMTGTGESTGAGGDTTGTSPGTGGGTSNGMTATGTGTGRGSNIFNTGRGNGNDITKVHDESSISSAGMIGIGRGLDVTGNDKSMTWTAKRMTGKGVGMGGIQQNGESSMPNTEDGDRIKTSGGMDTIPAAEAIDGTNAQDNLNFRYKRNIKSSGNNNYALNELARRILISIESALVANNDDGMCLRKSLCENNKYSRTLKTKSKIWIPVWSLGMSWLSGKLTKNIAPATSMLDSLKASILGLGNANCEIIYQDCNLKDEIKTRKRRK